MKFRTLLFAAIALFTAPAFAQVRQSGSVTPGHVAGWTTTGVIQDGGTTSAPFINNLGIVGTGTPFCINDAATTGPYHQLCLGANSLGGGILSYSANGGATQLPLQFFINGVGPSEPLIGTTSGNTTTFMTGSAPFTSGTCASFDADGNIVTSGIGCPTVMSPLSPTAGGTGISNLSGSTITLGGALTFSGAHPTTFTVSGTTGVTLPTSGTLSTLAGVEALSNKTITASSGVFTSVGLSGSGSGVVSILPQAAAGTWNFNLPIAAGTSGGPLLSGGGGATPMTWGTLSGNTTVFTTLNGAVTNTHCASFDINGNIQDAGAACGTNNSGTAGQMAYYSGTGTTVSGNANANISSGVLTLGIANSVIGKLAVTGSSSGTVTIAPQAAAGTYNFNLPTTAGTSGQPLLSAGGGASPMVFGTLTGNTTKFATASGAYTPGNCVAADASGNLVDNGTPCGSGGSGTVLSSTAGQIAYYPTTTNTVGGATGINLSSGGTVSLGVASTTQGVLKLYGGTSGLITITGQAAAGTYELDLPTTAGTSGQVLTSAGGAGAPMTWSSPGIAWGGAPKTTSFNGTANTRYCIDTATTGAVTMTLPASPSDGDQIGFIDCKSNFASVNFTVARNGNKVMGLTADMTVSTNNAAATLIYSSTLTDWRMY